MQTEPSPTSNGKFVVADFIPRHMQDKALAHFQSVDPALFSLSQKISIQYVPPRKPGEYFVSLCREIIGQQLSGKVADVIFVRFEKLFSGITVTPQAVLKLPEDTLRATGMSWSKVRFIRDLAQKVISKSVLLDALAQLPDDEVICELTKVKGIGPWTAEMFLMFTLGREDVFSFGDLGLTKAIQKLHNMKKKPTRTQLEKITKKWSPYRTHAALILWKSLELS